MTSGHKLILFASLLLLRCSSLPENKRTIIPNPTKYTFSCSKDSLRQTIISELYKYKVTMTLYFEGSEFPMDPKGLEKHFSRPENKEDFFLFDEFSPWINESYVYPGLKYDASFQLHLVEIDKGHTEVIVNTINPRVLIGEEFLPTLPHSAHDYKYHDVEPSTIEEYEILFKIGKAIKEDMPEVKYPEQTADALMDNQKK